MKHTQKSAGWSPRPGHFRTIAGWSPGVRELARTELLPCGCSVGIYNTWTEDMVAIADAVGDGCLLHREGDTLSLQLDEPGRETGHVSA